MVTTVDVKDAASVTRNVNTLPALGSAADAASLPVTQSTEDKAVLAAIAASASVLDDWDESDRAKVNPIAGQAGVAAGAGAVSALTQRMTLASDDPAAAVLGATTGAAVVTDANGTIQQYLRGLISKTISGFALAAGEAHVGQIGGRFANPTANFTRPADTTAYASGDLVANSTTAGSVVAMTLTCARVAAGSFMLRRLKLHKSGTSVTNASFRVHLFRAAPGTVTNGDNGAFSVSGVADYLGAFDVTIDRAFTDGAAGIGLPVVGFDQGIKLASGTDIFALTEARAAYTPASAEVFTATLDVDQD